VNILAYILLFTFLGSVVSLVGGILLLTREKFALKISHFLASFAAGTLLGTVFFDLLPEAAEIEGGGINIFFWTLIGILIFFLLERFIHHHDHHDHGKNHGDKRSIIPLIIIGDSLHNFIDGVAMAATFLISIPLGIVTSLAVAAHEIPQEIERQDQDHRRDVDAAEVGQDAPDRPQRRIGDAEEEGERGEDVLVAHVDHVEGREPAQKRGGDEEPDVDREDRVDQVGERVHARSSPLERPSAPSAAGV